jgi:hypothetical protein
MRMPLPVLPEMTLRASAVVPPMTLFEEKLMRIPSPLPFAAVPVASVPT